jgi:maltose-binding protein MalE
MNKNRIAKALSVLALLGGLFSCGGTPSSTTASSTAGSINSGSQNSDISSVSSSSAVKVTFWHTFNKTVSGYLDKKISEFTALVNKNDGVDLTIEESEIGDYNTILSTISKGLPVGNFPSMCVAYPDHIADYIASESTPGTYVVNLKDYADDSKVGFGKETWIVEGQ